MKKPVIFIALSALLSTFSVLIHAQNSIYLNARTIQTTADFDAKNGVSFTDAEVFNDKFYRLVQFSRLPMPNEKAEMAQKGIEIMDYIPDNAFILSLPKDFDFGILSKYEVKTVLILRGADKMSNALRESKFPDFAQKTFGKYDLNMQPYANVTLEQAAIDLQKRGFDVIGLPNNFTQTVTIRVKKADAARVATLPYVRFVDFIDGEPIKEDEKSNQLHRGNMLNSDGKTGLKYDGASFGIAIGDDGVIGPHIDFQGRLVQINNASAGDTDHGDATASTAAAAGNLDPALKSGASGATIISYYIGNYPQLANAIANQTTYKSYVTSSSYGQGVPGQPGCNVYDNNASSLDAQTFANQKLFHVFSAGNSGGGTCIAVSNYGSITGGFKLGKNVMTIGNVDVTDRLASSSSRGPSVDGRIKPDVCAMGTSVYATTSNNGTTLISGTSFSCPSTAATATQLYHAFSDLNGGQIPDAALIKAAILNTADDLGNVGPDFFYGWGRINTWRAYNLLKDKKYLKSSVSKTDSIKTVSLTVPAGVKQVKIMAYWHDPAASPNTSRALYNDLDMTVKNTGTGEVFLPWVLNSVIHLDSLSQKAKRGNDHVNNMEQVIIDAASLPALGTTTLEVSVKAFQMPSDNQDFYLVYEFNKNDVTVTYPNGGEALAVGNAEQIRWDAPIAHDSLGTFALDFSNNGGVTWQAITSGIGGNVRTFRWVVPNEVTGKACVRTRYVMNNGTIVSGQSENLFTVSKLTTRLTVKYVCPDSTYLSFDTVPGAKAYQICRLGAKYMDSIMTTSLNLVAVPQKWSDSTWYSVRPVLEDGSLGRRVNAIPKPRSLTVCPTIKDLQALRMAQNVGGTIYACRDGFDRPLSIWVKNYSLADIDSFRLGYQINTNTAVQSVVRQKIKTNDSILYILPQRIAFPSTIGDYTFKVWTKIEDDNNTANDTLSTLVYVRNRVRAPLVETFDNKPFPPDGFQVASSQGTTTWTNAANIVGRNGLRSSTAIFDGQLYTTRNVRDTLLTWLCDLSGIRNPQLSFDLSFQLFSLFRSPSLEVAISTDCGRTFKPTGYLKTRYELSNTTTVGVLWQPSRATDWRRDTVNLAAYRDSTVMLGFVYMPENDNRFYLDNINVENNLSTAIENAPLSIPMLTAFPNPSENGFFTVALKNFDAESVSVKVLDATGKAVLTKQIGQVSGDIQQSLDLQQQPSGVYLLQIQTEKKTYSLKVTKM